MEKIENPPNNPIQKYAIYAVVFLVVIIIVFFATPIGNNAFLFAQENPLILFGVLVLILIAFYFLQAKTAYLSPDIMLRKFYLTSDAISRGIEYDHIVKKGKEGIRHSYSMNACAFCFKHDSVYYTLLFEWDGRHLKFLKSRICYTSDADLDKLVEGKISFSELKKAYQEKKEIVKEALEEG